MKQGKRIISVVIILTILLLCLSACGVTKEKLLVQVGKNMLAAKSYTMQTVMDVEMGGDVLGTKVAANIKVDMNTDVNTTPFVGHGKGGMSIEVMGQSQQVDMELYEEVVENELTVYAQVGTSDWQKQSTELEEDDFKMLGLGGLAKFNELFELEDETVTMNGEECYKIKGQIDGETLQEIVDLAIGNGGQANELLSGIDWNGRQVPAEIYIGKKGKHLVKMSFDMIGVMDAALESTMGEFSGLLKCEKCILEISLSNVNKVEQIVIPSDVKTNAKEG